MNFCSASAALADAPVFFFLFAILGFRTAEVGLDLRPLDLEGLKKTGTASSSFSLELDASFRNLRRGGGVGARASATY